MRAIELKALREAILNLLACNMDETVKALLINLSQKRSVLLSKGV